MKIWFNLIIFNYLSILNLQFLISIKIKFARNWMIKINSYYCFSRIDFIKLFRLMTLESFSKCGNVSRAITSASNKDEHRRVHSCSAHRFFTRPGATFFGVQLKEQTTVCRTRKKMTFRVMGQRFYRERRAIHSWGKREQRIWGHSLFVSLRYKYINTKVKNPILLFCMLQSYDTYLYFSI